MDIGEEFSGDAISIELSTSKIFTTFCDEPVEVERGYRGNWIVRLFNFGYLGMLWHLGFSISTSFDAKSKHLFYVCPFSGTVGVLDIEKWKIVKVIRLSPGIRESAYDNKRDILYVSNYASGDLYKIKVDKDIKLIDRIFVGRRVRKMFYSEELDRLFIAGSNGFLELTN